MSAKKSGLLTKKVAFQGKEMTLYSIDGVTWSTRPDELEIIIQRHSTEQAAYSSDLKGEEREKVEKVKPKPKKFNRVHDDNELDEIIEEDSIEDDIEEDIPLEDMDDDIDIDLPFLKGKKESSKVAPIAGKAPKGKAQIAAAPKAVKGKNPVKIAPKSQQKKAPPKAVKAAKPAKAKATKPAPKGKKAPPVKGKKKAA